MLVSQIALRYAQAIYELAAERQELQAVEKQLALVEAALDGSQDLANLLYHPQVPAVAKKETLASVFGDELAEFVRNFLFLLIDKRRESALKAIIKEYRTLANEARNIIEAEVTTAMPLTEAQNKALAVRLGEVTGKCVVLKPQVNERIMGGVIVKIGDKLIDGSVVRQVDALRTALIKTEVTRIGVTY